MKKGNAKKAVKAVTKTMLEDALKEKNEDYYRNFDAIRKESLRVADYATISNKEGTFDTHGGTHLDRIQEKLGELLGVDRVKELNALELYVLLCAIYLHDISMAIQKKRADHPEESAKLVENSQYDWIHKDVKYIVADVIRSHGMNNRKMEECLREKYPNGLSMAYENFHARVDVLMALLRIGDKMDWAYDRAPEDIREGPDPVVGESFYYWFRHDPIESIDPNPAENVIVVSGRNYRKYTCRVLTAELAEFNEELNSNRDPLKKIGAGYRRFEFSKDTSTKMRRFTQIKGKSGVFFHPFISYESGEYLKLPGRDEDEEKLIKEILRAREAETVAVLTAESGVGKTSLMKARVVCDFQDMGFEVEYCDNIADVLDYIDKNLTGRPEDEPDKTAAADNGAAQRTQRHLVIMDQIERSLSKEKLDDLNKCLERVQELVRDKEHDKQVVYFLLSVSDQYVNSLGRALARIKLSMQPYFLSKLDIQSVVEAILGQEQIDYDPEIVKEIVSRLRLAESDDITNVHILFESLLENKELLRERQRIESEFESVENMVKVLLKNFFNGKFSHLDNEDKAILGRACNDDGSGARSAKADCEEIARLRALERANLIHFNAKSMEYVFVHDILAKKFYQDVLGKREKENRDLARRIHEGSLSRWELETIKHRRGEIAAKDFGDDDIANLILGYITEGNDGGEAAYWMQRYLSPEAVIENIVERVEKNLSDSHISYADMPSIIGKLLPIFDYAAKKDEKKNMHHKLRDLSDAAPSYRIRCTAFMILEELEKPTRSGDKDVARFDYKYRQALVEPEYEALFREGYCYLLHHGLLDAFIDSGEMPRLRWNRILNVFDDLTASEELRFYSSLYRKEDIDPLKFQAFVSLLAPEIADRIKAPNGEARAEIETRELSLVSGKIGYHEEGVRTDLRTGIKLETLMKFAYKERVDILFVDTNLGSHRPVAYFKEPEHDSCRIFTRSDVANVVRLYKIQFANRYRDGELIDELPIEIPKSEDEEMVWTLAGRALEHAFKRNHTPANLKAHVPDDVHGVKMSMLYLTLCYLNGINLRLPPTHKFDTAEIVLVQKTAAMKDTGLYDRFYIKLEGSANSESVDPYRISGADAEGSETLRFHLITRVETRTIKRYSITKELEFCGNGSPAIAVGIGAEAYDALNAYADCFSFRIMWDDKVNRVSRAIDAWEYELQKVLKVIGNNPFVKDLFVFGDAVKCRKTIQILRHYCRRSAPLPENLGNMSKLDGDIEVPYFQEQSLELLKEVDLHILDLPKEDWDESISEYFLQNGYSAALTLNNMDAFAEEDGRSDNVEEICKTYLRQRVGSHSECGAIQVEHIDQAYKAMLASLVCFGKKNIDSAGKDILDLHGFGLTVKNVTRESYHLSYRRSEIDEYYIMQWQDDAGVIKAIADTTEEFSVNQTELIIKELADTIERRRGNRKLTIVFYKPDQHSISGLKTPSLLTCFLMPRYVEDLCVLDVIFVWRTNECVLGLPMSLEAGIRWIDEKIISIFNGRVQLGDYTYFGGSMHCSDNFIMKQMIANIIQSEEGNTVSKL